MAVQAYFMAILIVGSVGGMAQVPPQTEGERLIAADPVLADVYQLAVVLATRETPQVERLIDVARLKARTTQVLTDAGIRPVEPNAGATPRLVVHIEGIDVPGGDRYVYRVQAALSRLVTVPGLDDRRFQAEVWQIRPVMAVAARSRAGEEIEAAVLIQVGAFGGVWRASQSLSGDSKESRRDAIEPAALSQTQSTPQGLGSVAAYPFVASKSSNVFHRANCRWAQNISSDNLVGYRTREEAIQSGKRPCKSCKP